MPREPQETAHAAFLVLVLISVIDSCGLNHERCGGGISTLEVIGLFLNGGRIIGTQAKDPVLKCSTEIAFFKQLR